MILLHPRNRSISLIPISSLFLQLIYICCIPVMVIYGQQQQQQQPTSSSLISKVALGTDNGYDVGGTDPLCYVTNIPIDNTTNPDTDGYNYTSIELLNDGIFQNTTTTTTTKTSSPTVLLRNCYNGTSMSVSPLGLNHTTTTTNNNNNNNNTTDRQLTIGLNYTFQLTLESNISAINEQIPISLLNGRSTIFFRILLCDAIEQGFCNPLIDTRDIDRTITPYDTDIGANRMDQFRNDTNRWFYSPNITLRGIDRGLLVFSRWCRWTLRQVTPEQPIFRTSVNITIQLPETSRPGAYFFIGHTVMNFHMNDNTTILRVDVADAIPDNVVEVNEPPTIHTVSSGMTIGLSIVIGIFGSIALGMLLFIISQRNHAVMKLAQGSFLGAIAAACCMQISCSFVFLPTQDIYCKLQGPLVIIPLTFVASCLVGRIWRVYKVLSVMNHFARLNDTRSKSSCVGDGFISILSTLSRIPICCTKYGKQPIRQTFRQSVSAQETASLIFMLTVPQIILQVIASAIVPWELEEELDPTGTIGRIVCGSNDDWPLSAGMAYAAFVYMLAVIMAWISRSLPSAFNEKVQIFHAATISTLLAFITLSLISITSDPTTHPDVQVFLRSLLAIGVATCVLFLIVWPKVYRVLSGEKVVMATYLGTDRVASHASHESHSLTMNTRESVTSRVVESSTTDDAINSTKKDVTDEANIDQQVIHLKKDDPLPSAVESKILSSESLLREVTEKCNEGRPLIQDDISLLQNEVFALYNELRRISFTEVDDGSKLNDVELSEMMT